MKSQEEMNQTLEANLLLLENLKKNNVVLIEKLKEIAEQQQLIDSYKQSIDYYPL